MFDNELNFEISIYDNENDLINRYNVKTEKEKDEIVLKYFTNDDESWWYEVKESKIIQHGTKGRY